jgi:ribosomal protein L17
MDVQPKEPAAVVFGGRRNFSFAVEAVIINADGETIASGSITLNSNAIIFYSGDRSITNPADTFAVFRFQNVNANDLTDNLTIGITKIDGIEAAAAGENGYVRIATGSKARMDRIDPVILAEQARQAELARQVEAARQAEQERQEKLAEQARVAAEQKRREELARIYPREIVQSMTAAELQRVEYESRGYSNVFKFRTRSEGGIEITGYTENINNIIIPSTISSNTVTAIGRSAYNKKNLTSVIIPNSVTSIGQTAFENNKLTSIIIPNSVKEIGYHAFLGNSITKISIPENVEMLKISFSTSEKVVDGLLTVAAIVAGGGLLAGLLSDSDEPAEPESFDNKFTEYYNRTGKRAGTYIYQNDAWVRQ